MSSKIYLARLLRGNYLINTIKIEATNTDDAWNKLKEYLKDKVNVYDDYYVVPNEK